jgi:hypothetical protein
MEAKPGTADEVKESLIRSFPEQEDVITRRDRVVTAWCADHGKDKDSLSIDDIMEIRALPEWQGEPANSTQGRQL